jgi:hypothetical protein
MVAGVCNMDEVVAEYGSGIGGTGVEDGKLGTVRKDDSE